ncbi:MAG: glutathione S-transferase family protein [Betaproteobacteria bacterium]
MLELYHHGSSVCAAKVRLALGEKGVEWKGHYLDILKGDQFDPQYLKLNPKAVVPTLVHDGNVIVESTVICEYADEVFDGPPLKPATALGRAKMRLWTKAVDEDVHPACGEITFVSCHRHIINRLPPAEVQRFLDSTPPQSVTPTWHERKKLLVCEGLAAPGVAAKFKLYDRYLQKMEDTLQHSRWLAGDAFTLADVGMAPYVNRLDMMGMSEMWSRSRLRLAGWFERVKSRETFKPAFLDWCPPDLTRDLKTFGEQTWPAVKRLLAA